MLVETVEDYANMYFFSMICLKTMTSMIQTNLGFVIDVQVSETGNDMKTVHRSYQVEAHVQSLNFVPLWGTDLGSPMQNVLSHEPVLKMKLNSWKLNRSVLREYFLPLIRNLVHGCVRCL